MNWYKRAKFEDKITEQYAPTSPDLKKLYNFIKSQNITYPLYHGTTKYIYEKAKKEGYLLSPYIQGTSQKEGRYKKPIVSDEVSSLSDASKKEKGLDQIFLTTNIYLAKQYAEQATEGIHYLISKEEIIKSINVFPDYPVVLELQVPIYMIQELIIPIINSQFFKNVYNEQLRRLELYKPSSVAIKDEILEAIKKHMGNEYIADEEEDYETKNEYTVKFAISTRFIKNVYELDKPNKQNKLRPELNKQIKKIKKDTINQEIQEGIKSLENNFSSSAWGLFIPSFLKNYYAQPIVKHYLINKFFPYLSNKAKNNPQEIILQKKDMNGFGNFSEENISVKDFLQVLKQKLIKYAPELAQAITI